jgi:amino acid transporter
VGRLLLADVVVAIAVATLAIQTSACRMLFSMARDGQLPFSARLARVNPRTGMPGAPAVVVGALAGALLLLNFVSPDAFLAIGTTCIVMLYLAYAMVTGPQLVRRLKGTLPGGGTDETGRPLFSLGRWGVPVNALALAYGLFMTINLAWPRAEVYDPSGSGWWFQWFTLLFLLVTVGVGLLYRMTRGSRVPTAGRSSTDPAH